MPVNGVSGEEAVNDIENVPDNVVNGDSYAARTAGLRETPRHQVVHNNASNDVPDRPRSAFFTPSRFTSARSVFDALKVANITSQEIACMQRRMNGEVIITFKNPTSKEKFLRLNSLKVGSESFAVQDIDRPLTFLTIYDAPFELSDLAIIRRLTPYCEVLHYRRGHFNDFPGVCNGLRHYRVRVVKPVPSFLRFGKLLLFLKHDGQIPTCRRCNQPGHFSNQCDEKICFNCENLGHEAHDCPALVLCSICKSDEHLGKQCPYSWYVPMTRRTPAEESSPVDVDQASNSSYPGIPEWVQDLELSDDEDENEGIDEFFEVEDGELTSPSAAENIESIEIDQPSLAVENIEVANSIVSQAVAENIDIDQTSSAVESIAEKNILDSQGFLQSLSLPVTSPIQRPPLLESEASESSSATVPEVIILDPPPPPPDFEDPSHDLDNNSAPTTVAPDPEILPAVPDPENSPAVPDPETSSGPSTSASSTPVSTKTSAIPVLSSVRGRRAPAPFPEPLSLLHPKATSPVLVTGRPRPTTVPSGNQNADTSSDGAMDTSSNLKRKSAPPKSMEKKVCKKGKK